MKDFKIQTATAKDFQGILALNQTVVEFTSELDLSQLSQLDAWSVYHKVIVHDDQVVAFLLVLPTGQPYASLNYRWFESQFSSFYYVDRIVVDNNFAGKKLGSLLYQDLIDVALNNDVSNITCEFNLTPLNEVSQAFHQSFGFQEVGDQWLDQGVKQVSLQRLELS